jgi:hypothetical protein
MSQLPQSDPVAVAVKSIKRVPDGLTFEQVMAELSVGQHHALDALAQGETQEIAAQRAGVKRLTVYRWMHFDPFFRAAYNIWQKQSAESVRGRLLKVAEGAVAAVAKAVAEGDRKLSYNMLKDLGLLDKMKDMPTEPGFIQQQMELEYRQQPKKLTAQALRELFQDAGLSPRQQRQLALELVEPDPFPPASA